MDIVLSRILRFLNGCLLDDSMYRIATFIVENYDKCKYISEDAFIHLCGYSKEDIYKFLNAIGQKDYHTFQLHLNSDFELRSNQIHLRMIGLKTAQWLEPLKVSGNKEDFINLIDELSERIYKANRIVIVGSHFPSSLTVDYQTDMITLGKTVVEYHHFDKEFRFKEDDIIFFLSATGRTLEQANKRLVERGLCDGHIVLVTQNVKFANYEDVCADTVIHLLGRFDGFEFNHQLLRLFDVLRIYYYQKYFL